MSEEVEEEMMALESIFYDSFSKIDDHRFRLRIDPDQNDAGAPPPLFLEISLPDGYPQDIPQFDLNNLNNIKYSEPAKKAILEGLNDQALSQAGENMCYNLAEWLKDKLPEFFALKHIIAVMDHDKDMDAADQQNAKNLESTKKEAKEKMTKSQKRRYFDRYGASDKPRGWDWVSIISHLSQRGPSSD